jgi:hypothetical protein
MSLRHVEFELEAKLACPAGGHSPKASGKLERKRYRDDSERLKISLRKLGVADGSVALVTCAGMEIAQLPITRDGARLDEEAPGPGVVPSLQTGQLVEVHVDGVLLLTGILVED